MIPARKLDDKGRCCGRKPLVYKRPPHRFCFRCSRAYNDDGNQITNWAWTAVTGGFKAGYEFADYAKRP